MAGRDCLMEYDVNSHAKGLERRSPSPTHNNPPPPRPNPPTHPTPEHAEPPDPAALPPAPSPPDTRPYPASPPPLLPPPFLSPPPTHFFRSPLRRWSCSHSSQMWFGNILERCSPYPFSPFFLSGGNPRSNLALSNRLFLNVRCRYSFVTFFPPPCVDMKNFHRSIFITDPFHRNGVSSLFWFLFLHSPAPPCHSRLLRPRVNRKAPLTRTPRLQNLPPCLLSPFPRFLRPPALVKEKRGILQVCWMGSVSLPQYFLLVPSFSSQSIARPKP